MAHNVPVVCDGFAVAIKERGAFQQPQKCGWSERGRRSRLSERNPEPPKGAKRIQSCYVQ